MARRDKPANEKAGIPRTQFLDSVVSLAQLRTGGTLGIEMTLERGSAEDLVNRATEMLRAHPGSSPVYVTVSSSRAADAVDVRNGAGSGNGHANGAADTNGATGANGATSASGAADTNGATSANGASTGSRSAAGRVAETVRLRSRSVTVMPSETLLNDLRELFGSDRIRLVRS